MRRASESEYKRKKFGISEKLTADWCPLYYYPEQAKEKKKKKKRNEREEKKAQTKGRIKNSFECATFFNSKFIRKKEVVVYIYFIYFGLILFILQRDNEVEGNKKGAVGCLHRRKPPVDLKRDNVLNYGLYLYISRLIPRVVMSPRLDLTDWCHSNLSRTSNSYKKITNSRSRSRILSPKFLPLNLQIYIPKKKLLSIFSPNFLIKKKWNINHKKYHFLAPLNLFRDIFWDSHRQIGKLEYQLDDKKKKKKMVLCCLTRGGAISCISAVFSPLVLSSQFFFFVHITHIYRERATSWRGPDKHAAIIHPPLLVSSLCSVYIIIQEGCEHLYIVASQLPLCVIFICVCKRVTNYNVKHESTWIYIHDYR